MTRAIPLLHPPDQAAAEDLCLPLLGRLALAAHLVHSLWKFMVHGWSHGNLVHGSLFPTGFMVPNTNESMKSVNSHD